MNHRSPRHHPPDCFINYEKTRSLKDVGEWMQQIGKLLAEDGQLEIDDILIIPADPCWSIMRYERMPKGELCLRFECMWWGTDENKSELDIGKEPVIKQHPKQ